MKRALYLLLLALIAMQYNCQDEEKYCETVPGNSLDDCKKLKLDDGDKYCCFHEGKLNGKNAKICSALSQEEYDDIDGYIDKLESQHGASDLKVDCGSNYIIISLLSLIILLL